MQGENLAWRTNGEYAILVPVMPRRPEIRNDVPFTEEELKQLHRNLALLSAQGVEDAYRSAHGESALERKPCAKTIQQLVTAWKILRKWKWR